MCFQSQHLFPLSFLNHLAVLSPIAQCVQWCVPHTPQVYGFRPIFDYRIKADPPSP